jgi:hypothetical protein
MMVATSARINNSFLTVNSLMSDLVNAKPTRAALQAFWGKM